jgi:PAS domain S-box-containing protein
MNDTACDSSGEEPVAESAGQLAAQIRQLHAVFEYAPVALAVCDAHPPYRVLAHNRAYQRAFGEPWHTQGMVGSILPDYLPQADAEHTLALFAEVVRTGQSQSFQERCIDGLPWGRTWWSWSLSPIMGPSGADERPGPETGAAQRGVIGLVLIGSEVTEQVRARRRLEEELAERQRAEQALGQSQRLFRAAIDHFPDVFNIYDDQRRLQYANRRAMEISGLSQEQLIGHYDEEVIAPEVADQILPALERAYETGLPQRLDLDVAEPSGNRAEIVNYVPVLDENGRVEHVLGFTIDITERKQVEEALVRQQEWLRVTLRSIGDAVIATDTQGRITLMNPAATALTGWNEVEAQGQSVGRVFEIIDERTRQPAEDIVAHVLEGKGTRLLGNHIALRARDGREIPIEDSAAPILDADGQLLGLVWVFHDVTARRQARAALEISEERARQHAEELEQLMDIVPAAIWMAHDPHCHVITGNALANRFLEAEPGENVSAVSAPGQQYVTRRFFKNGHALVPEELPMQEAAAKGGAVRDSEVEVLCPSGRRTTMLGNAVPLWDAEGNVRGAIAAFVDITARKQMEEHQRQLVAELAQITQTLEEQVREREQLLAEREWALTELDMLNRTLEEQVQTRTEQVLALGTALNLAEAHERERIAQVLHDDLQQLLYSQSMRLEIMRRLATASSAPLDGATVLAQLQASTELVDRAINVTRALVTELRPPALETDTIEEALIWLAQHMAQAHGLSVHLDVQDPCRMQNADMRSLLVQIARELLFNIVKHAGTDEARLALARQDGHVLVRVEDDGAGFDIEAVRARQRAAGGVGLFSISQRLQMVGGRLEIESAPGAGTRLTVVAPG